jgi:hypothetical protein
MSLSRKSFISACALGAAGALSPAGAAPKKSGSFKVCVFADIHYQPGVYVNDTPEFLEKILARAERENCDMVIHLGDFVHDVNEPRARAYVEKYNASRVPAFHVIGNHDQDGCPHADTLAAYRLERGYYSVDKGGFRFVVLDPNYIREPDGRFIHFDKGNYHRRSPKSTINWIPPDQLTWLEQTVVGSPYPCIVFSHQSFERAPNGACVLNKYDVQKIFRKANARKRGTVRLVVNGHMHVDNLRLLDNILYWDVNSASNQWYAKTHGKYPAEYLKTHDRAQHNIGWAEPLSAILTLTPGGGIRIDGAKADYLFGVTPRMAGLPEFDNHGRDIRPEISSAMLRLF